MHTLSVYSILYNDRTFARVTTRAKLWVEIRVSKFISQDNVSISVQVSDIRFDSGPVAILILRYNNLRPHNPFLVGKISPVRVSLKSEFLRNSFVD